MKELVGKKVKGFKFENSEFSCGYAKTMDKYINEIGEITSINEKGDICEVLFNNGKTWSYPTELIKKQLEPQYEVKMIVEAPNDFKQITDSIASLLQYKNEKYGNSALKPLNVFQGKCKVGQRLDDKLARVKNNDTLQKNDVADLIGYLFLVCKENEWNNFDEFKD